MVTAREADAQTSRIVSAQYFEVVSPSGEKLGGMGHNDAGDLTLSLKRHDGKPSPSVFIHNTEDRAYLGLWGGSATGLAGVYLESDVSNAGSIVVNGPGGNVVWSVP